MKKNTKNLFKNIKKSMTKEWAFRTVYQVSAFLISVGLVYSVANYAVDRSYKARKLVLIDSFTITAHTGSMNTKENSLESILRSIEAGADIVEFDVNFRPDQTPVMSHDKVISNRQGVLVEDAFRLISQYDDIKINLDIKSTTNLTQLQNLVVQYKLEDRAFLTGVTEKFLPEVKRKCDKLDYYYNYTPSRTKIISDKYKAKLLNELELSGAIGINCNYNFAGSTLSDLLHKNGYMLSVWTVNSEDDMSRCLSFTPDNITTRNPDVLINLIENWRNT